MAREYLERVYGKRHSVAFKKDQCGSPEGQERDDCPRCEAWKIHDMAVRASAEAISFDSRDRECVLRLLA